MQSPGSADRCKARHWPIDAKPGIGRSMQSPALADRCKARPLASRLVAWALGLADLRMCCAIASSDEPCAPTEPHRNGSERRQYPARHGPPHCSPRGTVSHAARYPTRNGHLMRHGIPLGMVSHPAWSPTRHGLPHRNAHGIGEHCGERGLACQKLSSHITNGSIVCVVSNSSSAASHCPLRCRAIPRLSRTYRPHARTRHCAPGTARRSVLPQLRRGGRRLEARTADECSHVRCVAFSSRSSSAHSATRRTVVCEYSASSTPRAAQNRLAVGGGSTPSTQRMPRITEGFSTRC
jgi:hypothetical protein